MNKKKNITTLAALALAGAITLTGCGAVDDSGGDAGSSGKTSTKAPVVEPEVAPEPEPEPTVDPAIVAEANARFAQTLADCEAVPAECFDGDLYVVGVAFEEPTTDGWAFDEGTSAVEHKVDARVTVGFQRFSGPVEETWYGKLSTRLDADAAGEVTNFQVFAQEPRMSQY